MSTQADIDALLADASALVEETADALGVGEDRPAFAPLTSPAPPKPGEAASRPAQMELRRLLRLEVPVIVTLAERTMSVAEVMKLSLGAILEFEVSADSELALMINNKRLGAGTAVKVGENFGLRITRVVGAQEKVKALGGAGT